MTTSDGKLAITFNGEIFNYLELRAELESVGYQFRTRSDTEVILHAYAHFGADCVHKFNGQWAFAIWDFARRRLFLSRDRLGVRPLFYATADGGAFLFGSEIKALFAHPVLRREIDFEALNQVFTFWHCLAPRTIFRGISQLPAGHSMFVDETGLAVFRYWQLDFPQPAPPAREDEQAEQLRELLIDATRIRLRADIPVGAYLSGGLDSTVTTALIRNFTSSPIRSFSVAFDQAEFDESGQQEEAVRYLGTDHTQFRCSTADIGAAFADVVWHTEQPILRTAPAPLFLLSRAVRENGFKVVMTGEGADEVLGGYDIFKETKIRRFCAQQPGSRWRPLLLRRLYPYLPQVQSHAVPLLQAFFHASPEDVESLVFSHEPRWRTTAPLNNFVRPELRPSSDAAVASLLAALPPEFSRWHWFSRAQYLESTGLLPGYILSSQGDRVAMAHSVEGRFPFLDYRVVSFAASLDPRTKMKVLNEKYLLKQAADGYVPPSVLRRKKQPYRAPEGDSFRSGAGRDLLDAMLAPERLKQDGVFVPQAVEKLVAKLRSGQPFSQRDNMAIVGVLSTQLVIHSFVNRFVEERAHATAS